MAEKKVSLVKTVLFTICSILVLDSLAPAPAYFGVQSITMWVILTIVFFIPYGLLTAELGSTYPNDGGITYWSKLAFGEHVGIQVGWFYWTSCAFWMPSVFITFSYWLSYKFFPNAPAAVMALLAAAMCWLICWIGIKGIELSVTITAIASLAKMAILIIFGILGFVYIAKYGSASDFSWQSLKITSLSDMSSGIAVIAYNLLGFELIGSIGSKIKNPNKTIPKMTLLAGTVITLLYLFGTFGILAALSQVDALDGFYFALEELCRVFGGGQDAVLGVLVIISCLTLVSNMIAWTLGSNEALIAADLDKRSAFLAHRSKKHGTADNLYIVMGILSTIMIVLNFAFGSDDANAIFWDIASFSYVVFLIPYLVEFSAAIRLRYKDKETVRVYSVPGGTAGMWVCGILCLICVGASIYFLFADDIAAGNMFAFWVKLIGTILCFLSGEILYRSGKARTVKQA
ncbi:MAG: APC family permease [Clostridiaceae bacterium]|nr:APC family permease [Clostridiaceae bacterium]